MTKIIGLGRGALYWKERLNTTDLIFVKKNAVLRAADPN